MPGTKTGSKKAVKTIENRYGKDFWAKIGHKGGKKSKTGGFAYSKQHGLGWHIEAGRKGGLKSKRRKLK